MTMMAWTFERGVDSSDRILTGRHLLLGFVLLIVLLYLSIVVLARFSPAVRKVAEFMGFKLTIKAKNPSSPSSVGSGEGPRKPAS